MTLREVIRDEAGPALWAVGFVIFAMGLVVGGAVIGERVNCRQSANALAVERRYDFPSGCYYRIDGRWIPADTYRAPEQVQR